MQKQTPEQIRSHIDSVVGPLNMFALAHYARLLKACGVKEPRIFREFFLP